MINVPAHLQHPAATRPTPSQRTQRLWWLWLLAVAILSCGLGLYNTGTTSLWYDEAFSVGLARQPLSTMLHYMWGHEEQMTLYYVLLHGYLHILNALQLPATEVLLRLPSIVCAALAAVVVTHMCWRFFGRLQGMVAGILFALSPVVIDDAQMVRTYAMQLFLVSIAWYVFLLALRPASMQIRAGAAAYDSEATLPLPRVTQVTSGSLFSQQRWRLWALLAVVDTLTVYAQIDSAVIIACQALVLGVLLVVPTSWRSTARQSLPAALAAYGATGMLILPLALDVARHPGGNGWVPPATISALITFFQVSVAWDNTVYIWLLLGLVALAGLITLASVLRRTPVVRRLFAARGWPLVLVPDMVAPAVAVILCWGIGTLALFYMLSLPSHNLHLFYARYLAVLLPPLCVAAGIGAGLFRPRPLKFGLALLVVLVAANLVPSYYARPERQNFRDPVSWLAKLWQPEDGVMCYPVVACSVPLDYYLQADLPTSQVPRDYPGDWDFGRIKAYPDSGPTAQTYLQQHGHIFLVTVMSSKTPPPPALQTLISQLTQSGYSLSGSYQTSTVQVALYQLTVPKKTSS